MNFNFLLAINSVLFYTNNPEIHRLQIIGTSKNFQKKNQIKAMTSDSEESYCRRSHGRSKSNKDEVLSFTPSTPPPTSVNYRTAKRRKGIPHRAPMGGLIIEY